MYALLVTWDLSSGAKTDREGLRPYLRERSVPRFRELAGLRQKVWLSQPGGKWGALYLFESEEARKTAIDHLHESPVVELTGKLPEHELFDVEAVVEGDHSGSELVTAGIAWQEAS
ncbi:MAG: hypothetical protein U5Q44_16840 [Dehalococcoidia bacterium]|nr:hypothetical protein [Dehalococcoidia bacterium]